LKKLTLLVLAAGLSSRYKIGLKQLDHFGPSGETIMDYAIYDAIEAGFSRVVFVIRNSIKNDFVKQVSSSYSNKIDVDFVSQELNDLPGGFRSPALREKPWGTGQAVWAARNIINEPFAVINADDFYGKESYNIMAEFLQRNNNSGTYAMIGFILKNTLSEHGYVSRSICQVHDGNLTDIVERSKIGLNHAGEAIYEQDGIEKSVDANSVVSMNFWGLYPDLFPGFEASFKAFLNENIKDLKSEFYLPYCIKEQVQAKKAVVKVLKSSGKWLGVTNPEDKMSVTEKLKSYSDNGIYPTPLF